MFPLPQHCTSPAREEAILTLSLLPLPWPWPLPSPSPSLSPLPLPTPSSLPSPLPISIAVGHCCCGLCEQLLPPSLLHPRQPSLLPLPSPLAIAISITISHCSCHLYWPSPLPSPSAISESCCLDTARIVFNQLKQRMLTLFCLDSGRRTDRTRMTDQVSSSDGQHQRWAASSKHQAASEGSGWQQGGSRRAAGWRR